MSVNVLKQEKPWAIMGLTRKAYEAHKFWKSMPKRMTRKQFEDMVREVGPEFFKDLKDYADAERLVEGIFGKLEDLND